MSGQLFTIDTETDIYLYGLNTYTDKLVEKLRENGFRIKSIIDRRASELGRGHLGIEVISMETVRNISDNSCAIIMLQNALNHDGVAYELHNKGFKRIVYIPMHTPYYEYESRMCEAYNRIVYSYAFKGEEIYLYRNGNSNDVKSMTKVIDNKDYKTVYTPYNMIYTAVIEKDLGDIPILMFSPYRALFEAIDGNDKYIEMYFEKYGTKSCNYSNEYDDRYVLRQREELFHEWEMHYYLHDGYFEVGAPFAKWNKNGHFNLLEGQHRVMFQALKGEVFIPLKMSNNDYYAGIETIKKNVSMYGIAKLKQLLKKDIQGTDWDNE